MLLLLWCFAGQDFIAGGVPRESRKPDCIPKPDNGRKTQMGYAFGRRTSVWIVQRPPVDRELLKPCGLRFDHAVGFSDACLRQITRDGQ